jgi:hypothetical protein
MWSQPKSSKPEDIVIIIPELTAAFQAVMDKPTQKDVQCTGANPLRLNHDAFIVFIEGNAPDIDRSTKKLRLKRQTRPSGLGEQRRPEVEPPKKNTEMKPNASVLTQRCEQTKENPGHLLDHPW